MILTAEEIAWVGERLDRHDIKYQEVYDELKDHLLTAIENLRAEGDIRPIEQLLRDVLNKQFPGWWPFDDIVKQYQLNYRHKIRRAMWGYFKQHLNWETIPLMMILTIAGFYLPQTKLVAVVMMITLLIASVIPLAYCYMKGFKIKTDPGRQSFVKARVITMSYLLVWSFNFLFNGLKYLGEVWRPAVIFQANHYPPVVFMLLLNFFIVYSLSCISLVKREFKIA